MAEPTPTTDQDPVVTTIARFVAALFDPADTIVIRPIETWTEAGRKRSRVGYKLIRHWPADPDRLPARLAAFLPATAAERYNVFVGVCPRFAGGGQYDLAWQVRTVRAVWVDIDRISVEDALRRVAAAGLPEPSIVVHSGNGVHLYWLLDTPYLIDDAGDPPPVMQEWPPKGTVPNKPRKYVVEDGDRIYLDGRSAAARLSAKAEHLQDVIAGVAHAVGGDHTQDLARLLRLPGPPNRKDEQCGAAPKPTALIVCDPSRRYPLAAFEPYKACSREAERAKQVAAMPLPCVRKPSAGKLDQLARLVAACGIAAVGYRSEADFAVCCFAIRTGIGADDVWSRVEGVGKFAEQGRGYFDRTWASAERQVREDTYDQIKPPAPEAPFGGCARRGVADAGPEGGNDADRDGSVDDAGPPEDGRPTIEVAAATTPVAETLGRIAHRLLASGTCYTRAGQLVRVRGDEVKPILTHPELAGLVNEHAELFFVDTKGGAFKPLPPGYGNTFLNQSVQLGRFPKITLFTRNPVYADDWRLLSPGYDPGSGVYTAAEAVEPRPATPRLDALLHDFCFRTPGDRTNYLGVLLTAVLMPRFVGCKPAVLFNGNQPGLGKTMLAQMVALLRDGRHAETVSYNPNDEEFEKRLGAGVRRGETTLVVDNAKAKGRDGCISSPCLERSITDAVVSFRLLGQSLTIRAENSLIFCVTANAANVSRDLVTRSVVVNLHHEGDPAGRAFTIADPEDDLLRHRAEVLGELVGMVERWKAAGRPLAAARTRFERKQWGAIVGGILAADGRPDFLANAAEAAATLDATRQDFEALVDLLADEPQGTWTAGELVAYCRRHDLLGEDLGDGSARSQSTRMGCLAGRYVGERFPHRSGGVLVFRRSTDRNGATYRVSFDGPPPPGG
ncbi:hypothetical protein [Limnoglobus roseus]|uniref:DNA primase/polymerase bifunctional N-terminal domain-containing protein n=1 Tax=Limnoglobus roseus TaxID=2598579 RepID=A0A5C1ATY6_9BACT|nr:hypothetical protein [Limnoglobus roseus]QEL20684.1 hypothetical protein PX52LOC_07791 [Limnoglobus roseus]